MALLLGVTLGIFILVTTLLFAHRTNQFRAKKTYDYTLIPNCLITRYPVVFVHGQKSLFYHAAYWNFLPDFIADHGYEVMQLDLPWRKSQERQKDLNRFLEILSSESIPCHWIADQSSQHLLEAARQQRPRLFRSLSYAENITQPESKVRSLSLDTLLHRIFVTPLNPVAMGHPSAASPRTIGKLYLKHLVYLAEQDLQHEDQQEDTHEPAIPAFQ